MARQTSGGPFSFQGSLAPRRLPGSAAALSQDDPAPSAGAGIAGETAAAAGFDAPTDIWTETTPARPTPPVTLPPPAEETRRPATVKGTLLELQFPAWVANCTFQTPS